MIKEKVEVGPTHGDRRPTRESLMRAVALFLDGVSRAVMLSFGPSLVYRLVYGGSLKLGMDCAKVTNPLALVVASYLIGRGMGTSLATRIDIPREVLPRRVARLAGAAISLLVFTFGAGLESVWWLILIRFTSAVLVGFLCVITKEDKQRKSSQELTEEEMLESGSQDTTGRLRDDFVSFASGTAKLYMTAFAVSILAGGLLYRHATDDATFRALTGSRQFTLSPLFLVAVSLAGESLLRFVFSLFESVSNSDDSPGAIRYDSPGPGFQEKREDVVIGKTPPPVPHCLDPSTEATANVEETRDFVPRDRSGTMESEFFDCNSVLSDMDDLAMFDDQVGEADADKLMSRYVDRQCRDGNGAPTYAPNGDSPDVIPENYLKLCGGNTAKAERMWQETQEWRRQHKVWRIHTMPNRWFKEIKKAYPHYIHGVSKCGHPIIYERPGKMNLKQLFRGGCDVTDMVRHYIFLLEFISNHICTREEVRAKMGPNPPVHSSSSWGTLVVMDIKGAGLSHLSGDVLTYLKSAGDINNSHYPLSLKRAFLVNSPFWLAGAWSTVKGILPESVQVDILSSHQYGKALREYIDDDQIPREYGGSSPYALGEHPYEIALHDVVDDASKCPEVWTEKLGDGGTENPGSFQATDSWEDDTLQEAASRNGQSARRRRGLSTDLHMATATPHFPKVELDDAHDKKKEVGGGDENDVFVVVSCMYALWSAVQGLLETAIPLWILTPPKLGGLGYAPSRSGVAMFSSTMVLLWVMRTKASKVISKIPSKSPMRSFRIGVGAESVLLLLLATVPKSSGPEKRSDAVLVMAITIIFLSCIVLSSMLGRASSTILHRLASWSIAQSSTKSRHWMVDYYGWEKLKTDCESGSFTHKLGFVAEVFGVLAVAPLGSWSLAHERPFPFDGSCCLLLSSLVTLVLYVCSFSFHVSTTGEFVPHPRDGNREVHARKCGSFLCEVATVSLGDMASLFEEANWSVTPLLGPSYRLGPDMHKK